MALVQHQRATSWHAALHYLAMLENDATFPRRRLLRGARVTSEHTEKHEKDAPASGARSDD